MTAALAAARPTADNFARFGPCATNPDLYVSGDSAARAALMHQCVRHCPVLDFCRAYAASLPEDKRAGMVLAGVARTQSGKLSPPRPAGWCPQCWHATHSTRDRRRSRDGH